MKDNEFEKAILNLRTKSIKGHTRTEIIPKCKPIKSNKFDGCSSCNRLTNRWIITMAEIIFFYISWNRISKGFRQRYSHRENDRLVRNLLQKCGEVPCQSSVESGSTDDPVIAARGSRAWVVITSLYIKVRHVLHDDVRNRNPHHVPPDRTRRKRLWSKQSQCHRATWIKTFNRRPNLCKPPQPNVTCHIIFRKTLAVRVVIKLTITYHSFSIISTHINI